VEPIAAWTPTLAVAGTDFYEKATIPEWQNSLLITSLKASRLVALKLSPDGRSVIREEQFFQNWFGRLRDLCISPDGRVFLAVSNRDGRGTVREGDDRIVEVVALNNNEYCTKEEYVTVCPGELYNFYGQEIHEPGIYTDTIPGAGGCDTIVSLVFNYLDEGCTGLGTMQSGTDLELSVYPNPVSGNELIIAYSIETEGSLRIYSQEGREVSSYLLFPTNNQVRIFLPEASGLYNLVLSNRKGISSAKVLKL
jgi:hypothetical protein